MSQGQFEGTIHTNNGTYYIDPVNKYTSGETDHHSIIYHDDDMGKALRFPNYFTKVMSCLCVLLKRPIFGLRALLVVSQKDKQSEQKVSLPVTNYYIFYFSMYYLCVLRF